MATGLPLKLRQLKARRNAMRTTLIKAEKESAKPAVIARLKRSIERLDREIEDLQSQQ